MDRSQPVETSEDQRGWSKDPPESGKSREARRNGPDTLFHVDRQEVRTMGGIFPFFYGVNLIIVDVTTNTKSWLGRSFSP